MDDLTSRLAERIRIEREMRSWSLSDLAERSGVSRAMISKIERGEASPTASLLGRLSGAFGLTLSSLLARTETEDAGRLRRRDEQPTWRDPETGFTRRAISPAGTAGIELVEAELPPGGRIGYPASAYAFIRQQIWILAGTLDFIEGGASMRLGPGDCLELGPPSDCVFTNASDEPVRYLVVVVRR
ncbi:MAG TPA: XRE family transcriptional regulator [Bosea sp. (in: a-proteobacteria)]|jgi:transcriptional regulator with XRE-family HTH domain|nr:XRE family transcriptional regulator [Bosea sp. (in: a-proteobacteria)]